MQNIVIEEYNNTNNILKCQFETNFNQYGIEEPYNKKLAITRLSVPSSRLAVWKLTTAEQSDYWMRMKIPSSHADAVGNLIDSGKIQMPIMDLYSHSSIIEMLNRMLYRTYEQAMKTLTTDIATQAFSWDTEAQNSASQTFTIMGLQTKISFIEVQITKNTVVGNHPYRLYLEHVSSGKKLLIASSSKAIGNELVAGVNFREGAYHYYGNYDPTITDYKPGDSFLDLKGENANGDWTLSYESDNLIDYDFAANLIIGSSPNITSAPFILLTSNNHLNLNYEAYYKELGIHLQFSNKLQKMIGFADYMKLSTDSSYFTYIYNTQIMDHSDLSSNLSHTQNNSSYYQLSNLSKIVVMSSNLQTLCDVSLSNENSSNVLADFTIDTSAHFENMVYSVDCNPFRKYTLLNNTNIKYLDIELYAQYKNGDKYLLEYEPSEAVFLRLTFFDTKEKPTVI